MKNDKLHTKYQQLAKRNYLMVCVYATQYVLIVCLLTSCDNADKLQPYFNYAHSQQQILKTLEIRTIELQKQLQTNKKDNPYTPRVKFIGNLIITNDSAALRYVSVLDSIAQQTLQMPDTLIWQQINNTNRFWQRNTRLKNNSIDLLRENTDKYGAYCLNTIVENAPKGDTSKFRELIHEVTRLLQTSDWNNVDALQGNTVTNIEMLSVIQRLKVSIEIAKYRVNSYLISMTFRTSHRSSSHKLVIIPEAEVVHTDSLYKATLMIVYERGRFQEPPLVHTEKDSVVFEKNKTWGTYRHKVNEPVGKVQINGYWGLIHPASGDTIKFPFKIRYQVVN